VEIKEEQGQRRGRSIDGTTPDQQAWAIHSIDST
jgi:hypothetical protein